MAARQPRLSDVGVKFPRRARRSRDATVASATPDVALEAPPARRYHVDVSLLVWCEAVGRERWYARAFCRELYEPIGGAGATALEAIAWCMDAWVRRVLLGRDLAIACHPAARPGDGLEVA